MSARERDYQSFVASKLLREPPTGLAEVPELCSSLFPFQRDIVSWCLRRGRAALFASTGLGKSRMQVEWAKHVAAHTGGRVLILAPLAVGAQTVREAGAIGVAAKQVRYGGDVDDEARIVVTNYDRLHHFDPSAFAGVVLDESSILKSFDGKTTTKLIESFRETPFRLAATATPSPNDYTELGTHAEFLGVCTRQEMLSEYFVNDASDTQTWRLKGHARAAFWRWIATWGALLRHPRDLGYVDARYDLPELHVTQHTITADVEQVREQGLLFAEPAKTLTERRAAKKSTVDKRVEALIYLVTKGCDRCRGSLLSNSAHTCVSGSNETENTSRRIAPPHETSATLVDASSTRKTSGAAKKRENKRRSGLGPILNDDMSRSFVVSESPLRTTNACSASRTVDAPSAAAGSASTSTIALESGAGSTSITAIAPGASEASSAPRATLDSASSATIQNVSKWPRATCDCARNEQWIIWCELNAEQDAIAEALGHEALSIFGSMPPEQKESYLATWLRGDVRILVSKASILGWGINMQNAARMAFVGVNDSFEQYYQAIRRCWRFGQTRPVHVHVFASELEGEVVKNLQRKERDAQAMAEQLSAETRDAVRAELVGQTRPRLAYAPTNTASAPAWLARRTG